MNCRSLALLAIALIGASPSPTTMIAGAVRDQRGAPIPDAEVEAVPVGSAPTTARTAADGTFVLRAAAAEVRITCAYCAPTGAKVAADGTVVAIVRRYSALIGNAPSPDDVAALPYARVESDLSLTPFVLLEDSTSPLPGPSISDRGTSPSGGLLVDNGIPNYDIVANASPFYTIPQHYSTGVSAFGSQDAYDYGDVASGGTYISTTNGGGGIASTGSDTAARASTANGPYAANAAYSSDPTSQQTRADLNASFNAPQTTTDFSMLGSRAQNAFLNDEYLESAFSGLHVALDRSGPIAIDTSLTVDRGSYALDTTNQLDAAWSDIDGRIDMHSNSTIAPFVRIDFRQSSGYYNTAGFNDSIDDTLGQAQVEGGVRLQHSPTIDGVVAIGTDDVTYSAAYPGTLASDNAHDAIAQLTYHPSLHWSLDASDASTFRLPTFLEANALAIGGVVPIDQERTFQGTLGYSDLSRLRIGITTLSQRSAGFGQATLASVGTSLGWQLAPKISARAWWMHVSPNDVEPPPIYALAALPHSASVGSGWLTYDNDGAFRLDVIWRRDLLDWDPNAHLDASASGPFSHRLRWFVSTEKRNLTRYTDTGLRW